MVTILGSGLHPRLYVTPRDVERLRQNVVRFEWGQEYSRQMQSRSATWVAKTDEELRALVPPPGSTFAYGFSGCPVCGASWPTWGSKGLANLANPNQVTCPKCKRVFPDTEHPDDGSGWRDPKSGEDYYFLGCYNAHAAQEITLHILRDLAISYAITGDEKHARAAAVVFDRLADTYCKATVGSIDYPQKNNHGRLERPQYQVARVLVLLANYLDLLYNSPEFDKASLNGEGTIRQHVERNIIRDGGDYCYRRALEGHMAATNGQADYVRGTLAAGIMLDDKKLIDVAVTGPSRLQNFLDNCIDRDGQYYETSIGYSEHCLTLYLDMAEMLYNLRTNDYPNGINFYANPRFQKTLIDSFIDINVMGHTPRFGDWGPDLTALTGPPSHFARYPYWFSEVLIARETDDAARQKWLAAQQYFADGDVAKRRNIDQFGDMMTWFAFHADPIEKPKAEAAPQPRAVLGGRGIITLRSGEGPTGRGALVRYGASLNHGHKDDLNLNFFGLGRELTYDLGYTLGSAHAQVGWTKLTASHNLVVVNEKNQMEAPGSGGSPHFYIARGPLQAMEASAEASYSSEGVRTYRRTMALVDLPTGGYLVDVFRVEGGNQHDLMWHFQGKLHRVAGATMSQPQPTGSLAGAEYEWGHKVGPSGYLIGCADKPDYWNPPPGNGYGFLCDVAKGSELAGECVATYVLDGGDVDTQAPKYARGQRVELRLLLEPDSELVTARAPGLDQNAAKADHTILRRKGTDLASSFVSVVEPVDGKAQVKAARRLACKAEGCVGIEVETSAGIDYILSSMSGEPAVFTTGSGSEIRFAGRFGFLRVVDGRVEKGVMAGGTELAMGAYCLKSDKAFVSSKVSVVENERMSLTLDADVLAGLAVTNDTIAYMSRDGYSRVSPYLVTNTDGRHVTLDGDFVLARGQVGDAKASTPDGITNIVPMPTARNVGYKTTGIFRGKLIRNDRTGETSSVIDTAEDYITIRVKEPAKFPPGDSFTIYDTQPGDTLNVPTVVEK